MIFILFFTSCEHSSYRKVGILLHWGQSTRLRQKGPGQLFTLFFTLNMAHGQKCNTFSKQARTEIQQESSRLKYGRSTLVISVLVYSASWWGWPGPSLASPRPAGTCGTWLRTSGSGSWWSWGSRRPRSWRRGLGRPPHLDPCQPWWKLQQHPQTCKNKDKYPQAPWWGAWGPRRGRGPGAAVQPPSSLFLN